MRKYLPKDRYKIERRLLNALNLVVITMNGGIAVKAIADTTLNVPPPSSAWVANLMVALIYTFWFLPRTLTTITTSQKRSEKVLVKLTIKEWQEILIILSVADAAATNNRSTKKIKKAQKDITTQLPNVDGLDIINDMDWTILVPRWIQDDGLIPEQESAP